MAAEAIDSYPTPDPVRLAGKRQMYLNLCTLEANAGATPSEAAQAKAMADRLLVKYGPQVETPAQRPNVVDFSAWTSAYEQRRSEAEERRAAEEQRRRDRE